MSIRTINLKFKVTKPYFISNYKPLLLCSQIKIHFQIALDLQHGHFRAPSLLILPLDIEQKKHLFHI